MSKQEEALDIMGIQIREISYSNQDGTISKDIAYCFVQVLEAAPHKTAGVWPFTPLHLINP